MAKTRLTPVQTAALMRRFRSKDTRPEMAVRRRLHAMGFRYRVHRRVPSIPRRTMDIAFPAEQVAVFIDGCFWHGCPVHGKTPVTNGEWWREKIDRNATRDRETTRALEEDGWIVVRRWEHDDSAAVAEEVARVVLRKRSAR